MSRHRSHRLHLGMTTPEEVAAYIDAFLAAFSQGSADVFGRLSKVRSELKKLLWTHPSGSLAGIADALEYLNLLLQEHYGISLETGTPDEDQLGQQQQSVESAEVHDFAPKSPAELTAGMLHQATQTDATSAPLMPPSSAEGQRSIPTSQDINNTDQKLSRVTSKGGEAATLMEEVPAKRTASGKHEGQEPSQTVLAKPAVQKDSEPLSQLPQKGETSLAGKAPDSLAMDTSTLHELTVLPSEHGRIPVSLRSPLPMAAPPAQAAKDKGISKSPIGSAKLARNGMPSPARELSQIGSRQVLSGRAQGRARQLTDNRQKGQNGAGLRRAAQPLARKQLHFQETEPDSSRRASSTGQETQRERQGVKQLQRVTKQQAKPEPKHVAASAAQAAEQQAVKPQVLHARSPSSSMSQHAMASSDSDTPRSAPDRLPHPVQQTEGNYPLHGPHHDLQRPELRAAHPAQPSCIVLGPSGSAQGAGMLHGSPKLQAGTLAMAETVGLPQQPQQQQSHVLHGMGAWIEQMTGMGAVMAASASAANTNGSVNPATQFQQGSTQFNHCHFTQSVPLPAAPTKSASQSEAAPSHPQAVAVRSEPSSGALTKHEEGIQIGVISGGQEGQEPQEYAAIDLDARAAIQARRNTAVETEAGTSTEAVAIAAPDRAPAQGRSAGPDSRLHRPLRKVPRRSVRFNPAVPTLKPHSSSSQRTGIEPGTSHGTSVPGRSHAAAQSKVRVPHKQSPKDTSQGERETAADGAEVQSVTKQSRPEDAPRSLKKTAVEATDTKQQPAFDYARALAALDNHDAGTLQQLHKVDSHRHEAAFEPLADLLLRPEALRHMDADSHGTASTGELTEAFKTPHQPTSQQHCLEDASMQTHSPEHATETSREPSATQLQVSKHEAQAALELSAVQLQLAERIADAVAARLSRKVMQSTAESPLPGHSAAQSSQSAALMHAEPDTACIDDRSEQQLSPGNSSKAAADPSLRYGQSDRSFMQQVLPDKQAEEAVGVSLQSCEDSTRRAQACEADFLAALLQGSPGNSRNPGQSGRPKACEEDFLAALLLGSPGSARHMRYAASPGLMHRDMCRQPDSRAAGNSMSAYSSAELWSAQWVGKLTREEMETAVQEVIAEELQGLFKEWHCPSELLPQVCSQMASSSLEVCQQGKACELSPSITQRPAQPTEEHHHSTGHLDPSSAGEHQRQLSAQALVSDSDPEAHSSISGNAAQTPTKEAFMHAVLQSLADICKDGQRDDLLHSQPKRPAHVPNSPGGWHSNRQTTGTADAAPGESPPAHGPEGTAAVYSNLLKPGIAAVDLEESAPAGDHKGASRMADAKESLSEPATKAQGLQRKVPKPTVKKQLKGQPAKQLAASTGPRSAVGQRSVPREAGPLVRLKATLRKPKIASKSAAAPQRNTQPAGPQNGLAAQPSGGDKEFRGEREPQTERAVDALSGSRVGHEHRESGESETEGVAGRHSAQASTAVETAETSSWHTELFEDSHSYSGSSTLIGSNAGVPAQQVLPDRPFLAAECSHSRMAQLHVDMNSSMALGMAEAEVHSSAVRGTGGRNTLSRDHESASRSKHQHKHPPRRRYEKAAEPHSSAASTGPASHSADETQEQYRQQKALAAKKKGKPIRHVHPSARREGTAERRRRLIAEAGLTDSLLFSSDSLSDTESERCKSSHRSSNSSDSDVALSSISSGASTPRAVSERKSASGSGASDTRMSFFTQPDDMSAQRTEGVKHDRTGAYMSRSESSSSQVVSTGASLVSPSHGERRRVFSLSSNDMTLESASTKETRTGIKTPWELPTLWTEGHKHATWGASHHLQERLAAIRTLPFRFT